MTEIENTNGVSIEDLQNIEIENYKELNPNSFPYWVFPKIVQDIINDGNKSLGFPIDFMSASIFYACALANGLSTKIEVKKGWEETTVMYLAIVGRAGTNKSHPLSFALKPIFENDASNYHEYEKEMEEFENHSEGKSSRPKWTKTIIQDITIEAVAEIHNYNKRGLGVYAEELNSWLKNMSRYNSGSDLEFWLSSWSSKPIIIDRKGSKSINIPQSFISVIGTIQNEILLDITGGKNSKNGFSDRVLFVIPNNLKKEYWSDSSISDLSYKNYSTMIQTILNQKTDLDEYNRIKPNLVRYSSEAKTKLEAWQAMNTDRYNSQISNSLDGVYSKMETYINRFALSLQIMFDSCESIRTNKVEQRSVEGAIEIAEYFIKQSHKVGVQNKKQILLNENVKKKEFYADLPAEFETKQAIEIGIATPYGFNTRYVERFLASQDLFTKMQRGKYKKT